MRAALGASRGRIVAHVLTESVLLTLTAGVVGLAFAWWTLRALVASLPEGLPRVDSISIDGVVVATVTVGIGLAAAVAGLVPAWLLARGDVAAPLRSGGRGSLGGPGRRMRRALVVLQVSLAVAIVAAAGLLVRTLVHLQSIDNGYASDALVLMELSLPHGKYGPRAQHEQFLQRAITELGTVPGIPAATPVNNAPFSHAWDVPRFTAEGQSAERAGRQPVAEPRVDIPELFHDAGDRDGERSRVRRSRQRRGAAGSHRQRRRRRTDLAGRGRHRQAPEDGKACIGGPWLTVVGVARSTRYRTLDTATRPSTCRRRSSR